LALDTPGTLTSAVLIVIGQVAQSMVGMFNVTFCVFAIAAEARLENTMARTSARDVCMSVSIKEWSNQRK
jgi:hypothetical protein